MTDGAQVLAAAVHGAKPTELRQIAVGLLRLWPLEGPSSANWTAEVSGVFPYPFTVPRGSWSSVFYAEVLAAGQSLNGRKVEVHWADSQPVIAYTVGG